MAAEQLSEHIWQFSPGVIDPHTHPRVFDALTPDNFVTINCSQEGRAGLRHYSEVALRSGITRLGIMPNEILRRLNLAVPGFTEELPYPVANLDRVMAMEAAVGQESVIPAMIYGGLEPKRFYKDANQTIINKEQLHQDFAEMASECMALKIYADLSTGGNNIRPTDVAEAVKIWHEYSPEKPVIIHAEDSNVLFVLQTIGRLKGGYNIPIHIAHVSSHEELEAVINAKEAGMNVTCEVTPHHLFFEGSLRDVLGAGACMKPSLKSAEDRAFLWANIHYIDMIASDCAPHRPADKAKENPAFGVTNHTVMLPLLLAAVDEGRLSMRDLYMKLSVNARLRFNLPLEDESFTRFDTTHHDYSPMFYQIKSGVRYESNPFADPRAPKLRYVGRVIAAQAGRSIYTDLGQCKMQPSRTHLLTPRDHSTFRKD